MTWDAMYERRMSDDTPVGNVGRLGGECGGKNQYAGGVQLCATNKTWAPHRDVSIVCRFCRCNATIRLDTVHMLRAYAVSRPLTRNTADWNWADTFASTATYAIQSATILTTSIRHRSAQRSIDWCPKKKPKKIADHNLPPAPPRYALQPHSPRMRSQTSIFSISFSSSSGILPSSPDMPRHCWTTPS